MQLISNFYQEIVPQGFYSNPQDTKYFSCDELLLEQIVSYIKIQFNGVNDDNMNTFERPEIFKKALPSYEEGKEVVFRDYFIVSETKGDEILKNICSNLAAYTRKWSIEEGLEFDWLYLNGYDVDNTIQSKDNAIDLFLRHEEETFAKYLDYKDVVKLSIQLNGEKSQLVFDKSTCKILKIAVQNAKKCPLTKKQAKYFNTICKKVSVRAYQTNIFSPYRLAKAHLDNGKPIMAAHVLAEHGSLLERNLVWLLSRANIIEAQEIINLLRINNPIVALQLSNFLMKSDDERRIFKFYKNNMLKYHRETDDEMQYRKSRLSEANRAFVADLINEKIHAYYQAKPKLGKIYIGDEFKKIAPPFNTSASGSGIDVLPVGSRLPVTGDYIRTFCYWKGIYDIDTSVVFLREDGTTNSLGWFNYHHKPFGDSCLCSGDDRSNNGVEYQDFKISELMKQGYTHAIYTLNGFDSNLNKGEISRKSCIKGCINGYKK